MGQNISYAMPKADFKRGAMNILSANPDLRVEVKDFWYKYKGRRREYNKAVIEILLEIDAQLKVGEYKEEHGSLVEKTISSNKVRHVKNEGGEQKNTTPLTTLEDLKKINDIRKGNSRKQRELSSSDLAKILGVLADKITQTKLDRYLKNEIKDIDWHRIRAPPDNIADGLREASTNYFDNMIPVSRQNLTADHGGLSGGLQPVRQSTLLGGGKKKRTKRKTLKKRKTMKKRTKKRKTSKKRTKRR